jgi:hypothetical protein
LAVRFAAFAGEPAGGFRFTESALTGIRPAITEPEETPPAAFA